LNRRKTKAGQRFTSGRALLLLQRTRHRTPPIDSDSGAQIRDGIKKCGQTGNLPPKREWPYVIARLQNQAAPRCYADALKYRALYQRLTPILSQLKKAALRRAIRSCSDYGLRKFWKAAKCPDPRHASLAEIRRAGPWRPCRLPASVTTDARQWFVVRNFVGAAMGPEGLFYLALKMLCDRR